MAIVTTNFKSNSVEYSTPLKIIQPLIDEFDLEWDVCASKENHKLPKFYTKEDNFFTKELKGNCWMNPPFCKDISKYVKYFVQQSIKHGGTKVCLIPVRSNTKWWNEIILYAEIRFIIGEVNFNDLPRGMWLPCCILIFGDHARVGRFTTITYKK